MQSVSFPPDALLSPGTTHVCFHSMYTEFGLTVDHWSFSTQFQHLAKQKSKI